MRNAEFFESRIADLKKFFTTIPHSAFRIPHSAFRIPHSAFRIPHSAFRILHSLHLFTRELLQISISFIFKLLA
jgi:hypothetical protein